MCLGRQHTSTKQLESPEINLCRAKSCQMRNHLTSVLMLKPSEGEILALRFRLCQMCWRPASPTRVPWSGPSAAWPVSWGNPFSAVGNELKVPLEIAASTHTDDSYTHIHSYTVIYTRLRYFLVSRITRITWICSWFHQEATARQHQKTTFHLLENGNVQFCWDDSY